VQENLGAHILWHLPVLGSVHADTIVTTWVVMVLSLAFFAWVGASYRRPTQTKRQVIVEGVVNYLADLATSTLGKRGEPFVPFFIALFVFIFLLNQFGFIVLPFKALWFHTVGSPTADLNTTVPLALTVWLGTWLLFPTTHAKHLVQPFAWLLPINLIEELSRPLTLAARLFFNIFVGELLFMIVASIIEDRISIGALNLSLAVAIVPFFIQFFNFFVGTVQAFVFTLLAIVYFSLAIGDSH
jgi:F-type H+-transporting ATPase subunit a